jgi:hypothetical protein
MANGLIPLDRGPSNLAKRKQSTLLNNARSGVSQSFGVLSYRGKTWRLKYQGIEQVLRDNERNLDCVIVGVSPNVSKNFYPKQYTEGDSEPPVCFSTDGIRPDASAPQKQNDLCATCKNNEWGSRMTPAGKRAKACADSRRLAIVPLEDIENDLLGGPMLLRVPPTSLVNLSHYADFLAKKGASFEMVGTRISFEDTAYPKLMFNALGFLSDDQQMLATGDDGESGVCASPAVNRILTGSDVVIEQSSGRVVPLRASDPPQQTPPQKEEDDEEEEEETPPPPPPQEPPPQSPAARNNPFAAVAAAKRQQQEAAPVVEKRPPQRKKLALPASNAGNGGVPAAAATKAAPTSMESAINDLLDLDEA